MKKIIQPGDKFGKWTVKYRIPLSGGMALCKCDCGTEKTVMISSLKNGASRSCGCIHKADPGVGYGRLIPGTKFGRYTLIKRVSKRHALCKCDCGNERRVWVDGLISGNSKSCGCLLRETTIKRNQTDAKWGGFSKTHPKVFRTWMGINARCYRPQSTTYHAYGAKGIIVCQRLRKDPRKLLKIMGLPPSDKHTIDRYPIFNGNYTCGVCKECKTEGWKLNVRWATMQEQCENKGTNVFLEAFGKRMIKSQWCRLSGISEKCLSKRIKRGWSIEKSLTVPDSYGNYLQPDLASALKN